MAHSNYDSRWCDDERGPLQFTHRTHQPETFVHINQLTKDITKALDERKWEMQWNEVEWKSNYYENSLYTRTHMHVPKYECVEDSSDEYVECNDDAVEDSCKTQPEEIISPTK